MVPRIAALFALSLGTPAPTPAASIGRPEAPARAAAALRPHFYEFGRGAAGGEVRIASDDSVRAATAADRPDRRGARAELEMAGDFQLEVDVEVTGLSPHGVRDAWLGVTVDAGPAGTVTAARGYGPDGYAAYRAARDGGARAEVPAISPRGRLGLRREGDSVAVLAAEVGQPLREFARVALPPGPVRGVALTAESVNGRIVGQFSRFAVRAGADLPPAPEKVTAMRDPAPVAAAPAAPPPAATAAPAPQPPERGGSTFPAATFAAGVLLGAVAVRPKRRAAGGVE